MAEEIGIPRNRYFHHHCMLVVMDCMNSAVSPKGSFNTQLIEKERFDKFVVPQYQDFFSKAAATYQKCIYMHSPCAEFWGDFADPGMFNTMVRQVAGVARQASFLVFDSTPLFITLDEYRKSGWHFTCNRQEDYGLAAAWQRIIESVVEFVKYMAVPPLLSFVLDSMPKGLSLIHI